MKICKCCNLEKPSSSFIKDKTRSDGLYVYCKECNKERRRVFRENNKEKISCIKKEYYINNKDLISFKKKEAYRSKKKDIKFLAKKRNYNSKWKRNNKGLVNYYTAKRRSLKLKATCNWGEFNDFILSEAYDLASLRSKITSIKWEVDHIVPLVHDKVCGLHSWTNIQVIPEIDNRIKSNTFII